MGSLENTLTLARAIAQTVKSVQAPSGVRREMDSIVYPTYQTLLQQGPRDQWWEQVEKLFTHCTSQAPPDCKSLTDYGEWIRNMHRLWSTILATREMLIRWTGTDPKRKECNIVPSDLLFVRSMTQAEAHRMIGDIEQVGNETLKELKKRGIDCFGPMTTTQYQGYFVRHLSPQTRFIFPKNDPSVLCGFYNWVKASPPPPKSILNPEQRIGNEVLSIRTLWPTEIVPDRVAFRSMGKNNVRLDEGAIRIMLDLMQVSIDTKLPVTLPPSPKKP